MRPYILMDALLEDIANDRRIELGETTHIGRSKSCQIHLPEARISRQHAMIRHQDSGYWFYDLGSANGSYINGRRVTVAQRLEHGDTLGLSDHQFTFLRGDSEAGKGIEFEGRTIDATIADIQLSRMLMLVSDIKQFTKISEKLPPEALAQAIGGWYRDCNRLIKRCGGSIDKFVGDALLAYWPDTSHESRRRALVAAGSLREVCAEIQADHRQAFDDLGIDFELGVGIHIGSVAHGPMSEGVFTLLGDAVNVAFRIESLTRKLQKDILVSEDFLEDWEAGGNYCSPEGSQAIKGRSTPLVIYSVTRVPDDETVIP